MKLLLVHPTLGPSDPLVRSLQSTGAVILVAHSNEQAKQLLAAHSTTLEVAVIHREPEGLSLVPFMKAIPALSDLPFIITSSEWSESDFSAHQETPEGANAYLKESDCERDLRSILEQVLGGPLEGSDVFQASLGSASGFLSLSPLSSTKASEVAVPPPPSSGVSVRIEDATRVYSDRLSSNLSGAFKLDIEPESHVELKPEDQGSPVQGNHVLVEPTSLHQVVLVESSGSESSVKQVHSSHGAVRDEIEIPDQGLDLAAPPIHSSVQSVSVSSSFVDEAASEPVAIESSHQVTPIFSTSGHEPAVVTQPETESSVEPVSDLPYLFGNARPRPSPLVGDVVVPGGAAQSPDIETLKRYLALREQDVAALSSQLRDARNQIRKLEEDVRQSHALMEEQNFRIEGHSKREKEFEREKALLTQGLQAEIDEMRFQMKARVDKARNLESEVRESSQEMERLRERVRHDIRKIRVREKELENRLEIVKKDSEALLTTRESTILELKRKLDTAEFNLDLMHDRLGREKETSAELREKLLRASQAVRLAGGLLDPAESDAGVSDPTAVSAGERSDRKIS